MAGEPLGLPLPGDMTSLSATMRLDSTKGMNDPSALVAFSMATGTQTWTQADLNPNATQFVLYSGDTLLSLGFVFRDAAALAAMNIASVNSWSVTQSPSPTASYDNSRYCNGCVSFVALPAQTIPDPSSDNLTISAFLVLGVVAVMRRGRVSVEEACESDLDKRSSRVGGASLPSIFTHPGSSCSISSAGSPTKCVSLSVPVPRA